MKWQKAREAIEAASPESSVYIGCDSNISVKKINGKKEFVAEYATVVILHIDSCRGCKIFHNTFSEIDYGQIVPRMLEETRQSIEAYECLKEVIGDRFVEIHIDVNSDERYASHSAASAAVGWVRSIGLEAKIKPDSPAATHAADHVVRRKSIFKHDQK